MNGAHDCGGMMGYGPINMEVDEPAFHHPWEARMYALMSAIGDVGGWSIDEDRSACESMEPGHYITSSYYEHWLHGLQQLLQKHRLATQDEIATGRALSPGKQVNPTLPAAVWSAVTTRNSYERQPATPARFAIGTLIRTRNINPETHTRLPRYLRARVGEVTAIHGPHVFPDSNAAGRGEDPHWLYTVRFTASEIWGTASADTIHADLWEPYLEPL